MQTQITGIKKPAEAGFFYSFNRLFNNQQVIIKNWLVTVDALSHTSKVDIANFNSTNWRSITKLNTANF